MEQTATNHSLNAAAKYKTNLVPDSTYYDSAKPQATYNFRTANSNHNSELG